jgi:hypothetical protein
MGSAYGIKQLFFTLRIEPAAQVEHGHGHRGLHFLGCDFQIAVHNISSLEAL